MIHIIVCSQALALSNIGRVEDVIPILKSILQSDVPHQGQVPTFNTDVLEKVKSAVEKLNKPDITAEFDRLYKLFKSEGHVSELVSSNSNISYSTTVFHHWYLHF